MNQTLRILLRPALMLILFFFVGASACSGCSRCGPNDQIGPEAEKFPVDTRAAAGIQSLEALLSVPEQLVSSDHLSSELQQQWQEALTGGREQLEEIFGIDPADPQQWKTWGIDPGGSIFFGLVERVSIVCFPIADEDDFDAFVIDPLATELFEFDDPERSTDDIDGQQVHSVNEHLAWGHVDDRGCLAVDFDQGQAIDAVASFLGGPGDDSLADHPGFKKFAESELPGSLIAFYAADDLGLFDYLFDSPPASPSSPIVDVRDNLRQLFLAYGSTATIDDDVFRLRLWAGMDDDDRDDALRGSTPRREMDWSSFATKNTSAALRLSGDPNFLWEQFQQKVDEELMSGVKFLFDEISLATDGKIDVEDDLISNLSGHIGLFVYDIVNPDSLFGIGGPDLQRDLEFLLAIQFVDRHAMIDLSDDLADLMDAEIPLSVRFESLRDFDDIEVLDIPMVGFRLYRSGHLLVLGNDAMSASRIASILQGDQPHDSLSDTKAVLGPALQEDSFNGLYLGGDAWDLVEVGAYLPRTSDQPHEALYHAHITDTGIVFDVEFFPAGSIVLATSVAAHEAFKTYIDRSKAAEAQAIVSTMALAARAYYELDQQFSSEDGREPWHMAETGHPTRRVGMPVAFSDKVFPGGPSIKVKTSPQIPEGGERISPQPVLVGDVDFEAQDVFRKLNLSLDEPLYFRYTFETGPATGDGATATIRAEANFDPTTSDHHTVIQRLEVTDWGVDAQTVYTENDLQ